MWILNNEKLKEEYDLIKKSGLFNTSWYTERYLNISDEDIDPLIHFVETGWKEGKNPHPDFDIDWYASHNVDKKEKINPLIHYIKYGQEKNLKTKNIFSEDNTDYSKDEYNRIDDSGFFYPNWYKKEYLTDKFVPDLLDHYLKIGYKKGYNPNPNFDIMWYTKQHKDIERLDINPLLHYVDIGSKKGYETKPLTYEVEDYATFKEDYDIIKSSGLFDDEWFVKNNPNIKSTNDEPIVYYLLHEKECEPIKDFNSKWYYENNHLENNINPLIHYITVGQEKGLQTLSNEELASKKLQDDYDIIKESKLFDDKWYLTKYNIPKDYDPLYHYVKEGYKENNPYSGFNTKYYIQEHPNLLKDNINPLVSYIKEGINEGYPTQLLKDDSKRYKLYLKDYSTVKESELYDEKWYVSSYPDLKVVSDPLKHFLLSGWKEKRNPGPDFDTAWYIDQNPELKDMHINPLIYHINIGQYKNNKTSDYLKNYEDVKESGLFDKEWYVSSYPDLKVVSDPLKHFLLSGWKEKRNPGPDFDTAWYIDQNPELKDMHINPLIYHINIGQYKNNETSPNISKNNQEFQKIQESYKEEYDIIKSSGLFDEKWYVDKYLDYNSMIDPVYHYIKIGWKKFFDPFHGFNSSEYLESNREIEKYQINPLIHYIMFKKDDSINVDSNLNKKVIIEETYNDVDPEDYVLVQDSEYFDKNYYLKANLLSSNTDAIKHYITIGYKKGYNPSKKFDNNWYIKHYLKNNSDINPLIDFIKSGETKNIRSVSTLTNNFVDEKEVKLYTDYMIIHDSNLFNEKWYKTEYNLDENIDSILHYLEFGTFEGYDPSAMFSTNKYYENNLDVKKANINPLAHYIKTYDTEHRLSFVSDKILKNYPTNLDMNLPIKNILDALNKEVTIILPIHDSYVDTCNCIKGILENTTLKYNLILIKEGNVDKRMDSLLRQLGKLENVKIVYIKVKSKDRVLEIITSTKTDVVLLKNNVILTPNWLSKLIIAAYSEENVGMVNPILNTDLSIKELQDNDLQDIYNNSYKIRKQSEIKKIYSKTVNTACVFVKKEAITDINFIKNENDLNYLRFINQSTWKNLLDYSTFVYQNDDKLLKQKKNQLSITSEYINSKDLKYIKKSINEVLKNSKMNNLLYVTKENNQKLLLNKKFNEIRGEYTSYILSMDDNRFTLWLNEGKYNSIITKIQFNDYTNEDDLLKICFNLFNSFNLDVILVSEESELYNVNYLAYSTLIALIPYFEIKEVYTNTKTIASLNNKLNPDDSIKTVINNKLSKINFNHKKLVVYTAVTNNQSKIDPPCYINDNVDYVCFTDNPNIKSNFWQIRLMDENLKLDSIRKVSHYKILAHNYLKEYDYSLWIDPDYTIENDIIHFINNYFNNNCLLCVAEDYNTSIYYKSRKLIEKDENSRIDIINEMNKYDAKGYPKDSILLSNNILFRKHNDKTVIKLMQDWYNQYIVNSCYDQLSFNYILWKYNFDYDIADLSYCKNSYFGRKSTNKKNIFNTELADINRIEQHLKRSITIIIFVSNNLNQFKKCIQKVIKNTVISYEIIVVNNDNDKIKEYVDNITDNTNIKVINNVNNMVTGINLGISYATDDVILLNSNVEVTPHWITKLMSTVYENNRVGVVSPVTNDIIINNKTIKTLGIDNVSNIIEKNSEMNFMVTSICNDSCIYIKKDTISSVGFLDPKIRSIKEAIIDFCIRCNMKNRKNLLDYSTYVYQNKSLKNNKEHKSNNQKYIETKYPEYNKLSNVFNNSINYQRNKQRINLTLNATDVNKFNKKRILYVIHESNGGTPHTTVDLISEINVSYDTYILTANNTNMKLWHYDPLNSKLDKWSDIRSNMDLVYEWNIHSTYSLKTIFIDEYKQIYYNVLRALKIDIVHIRHLMRHTFDLPYVANELGIPVILSFHDYYYVCPSHMLVDDLGNYCAGNCSPIINDGEVDQDQCYVASNLNVPILKTFVKGWRKLVSDMLKQCSYFITTSNYTKQLYCRIYPQLENEKFDIIEHGRDLKTPDKVPEYVTTPSKNKPIKIVFPGHIGIPKGVNLIKEIKNLDKDNQFEFHYMGSLYGSSKLDELGIDHGLYERGDFCKVISEIKPSFIGIFSIWPETYCHILTEALSCGVPVITLDMGAIGERMKRNGGGWFIKNNPKKAYETINEICENPEEYDKVAKEIINIQFVTVKQMAKKYEKIYNKLL